MNTIRSFLKFFDNQAFKIHFYSIQRRSLLYSKKLLDVQDEVEFVDEQLAENQEAIKETHEEIHEEAIQETHEGAIEETHEEEQEEADDGINETDKPNEQKDTEHTEFFLNIPSGDFRMKFERSFDKMKAELKWYLSNGKCVEDELFAFGMQCKEEHPCHSFIVDPADTIYQKYQVFNDDELREIGSFREKKLPTMPTKLRDYLNTYNLTTSTALRQKIFTQEQLDEEYFDNLAMNIQAIADIEVVGFVHM